MQIQINIIFIFFAVVIIAALAWEIFPRQKRITLLSSRVKYLEIEREEYKKYIQNLVNTMTKETVDMLLNTHFKTGEVPGIDVEILDRFVDRAILHINEWMIIKNMGRYERRLVFHKGAPTGIVIMFHTIDGHHYFIANYLTNGE